MKLLRLLQTDLYRAVVHADFWIAALLFGALCFTAEGYWEAGRSITVLELALFHPAEEINGQFLLSNYHLFLDGIGPYNLMFAPILAAIPSIPAFCQERRNGYLRFLIPRCGVTRRCLSLWLSALLSGGLVVTAGYGLYGLGCWILFPSPTAELVQRFAAPVWSGVLAQLAGAFFFGMVAALLPVLLAGVSQNTCFVLCTAFALFYTYCNFLDTLSNHLFDRGELEQSFQVMMLYPTSVFQCFSGHQPWRLALWGIVAAAVYGLLRLFVGRRLDKGA